MHHDFCLAAAQSKSPDNLMVDRGLAKMEREKRLELSIRVSPYMIL